MKVEKEHTFTSDDVVEWCRNSEDDNKIHLDQAVASDTVFGERVVPGMMLLDRVSGQLSQYGEAKGRTVILAGIVAARFRDPVFFDETVTIVVEPVDEDNQFTYFNFEATVEERNSRVAHGEISVVLN